MRQFEELIKQYQTGKPVYQFLPNLHLQISIFLLFAFLLIPTPVSAEFVNLQPGYNLFSLPVEPLTILNCKEVKTKLSANKLSRLDVHTQSFEQCNEIETGFSILPGIGYVVDLENAGAFDFQGKSSCPFLDLAQSINLK